MNDYLERPTKEAMRLLPPFAGLPLARIHLVRTEQQAQWAHEQCVAAGYVGFDTESKPTFHADQPRNGPHLLQLATDSEAFLFSPELGAGAESLRQILSSASVLKVGFGLASDRGLIMQKLGVMPAPLLDLAIAVRRLGYKQQVGLQSAVAIVLGRYLQKSKRVTTSNWAAKQLSSAQLLYAANDAYAGLCVYRELLRTTPQVLALASVEAADDGRRRRRG